jgi:pimeloyl-ACP methyl ester carboxylesterase
MGWVALLALFAGGCAVPSISQFVSSGRTLPAAPRGATGEAPVLVVITYGYGCGADGHGNGLRDVAEAIRTRHPASRVITRAWNDADAIAATVEAHRGPVVLVGHSFGGCRTVELAAQVRRPVDAVVLLDPVPCDDWAFRKEGKYFQTPGNVGKVTCFHRPAGGWPTSYPVVSLGAVNREVRIGHSAFGYDEQVRACIADVCDRASAGGDVESQTSNVKSSEGGGHG